MWCRCGYKKKKSRSSIELYIASIYLHDFLYFQSFTASQSNNFIININDTVILNLGPFQWAQTAPSPFSSLPVGGSHL